MVVSKETSALAAPAHDVLEDWAIIQWLGGRFSLHEQEARALADDIAGYPAIRRTYRRWLGEMLECETERADAFVLSSFRDESLPAYFRDDTLVSTLLSSSAQRFLERQRELLIADEGRLLVRVIHLLRVACKTTPRWLAGTTGLPSQLLVPQGDAWAGVLKLVSDALDRFLPVNLRLLLGLVEDWARSVQWGSPEPDGFGEAGKIAFALLPCLSGYGAKDLRKRVLEVIATIPRADAAGFENLLQRGCARNRKDSAASDLATILLTGLRSGFACREFPTQIARLTITTVCLSDKDLRSIRTHHPSIDVECCFGIRDHTNHDFFPASAIRGPFLALLRTNPRVGVQLIIDLLNHACTWYGEQRWPFHRLEEAWRVTLEIPGEGQITQWANARLWCLSRGMSVGPYGLQTALMALESWLLGICEIPDVNVEGWLLHLLRNSNNVTLSAVVASICNAYPEKGSSAALALLSSPALFGLDRARMVQESGHSMMSNLFPAYNAENKIYNEERKKSDSLPHRGNDLEALAVKLQFGRQRDEVWQILDRHRAALPSVDEQSEKHRLWRLAMHRMDIRGFRPVEPEPSSRAGDVTAEGDSGEGRRIYFAPGAIEEDVQGIVDRHAPVRARFEADLALLNWGRGAWERDRSGRIDLGGWHGKLMEAKARDRDAYESEEYSRSGPGFIAGVCTRDHWDEMSPEDREWCVAKLIDELERACDSDVSSVRLARGLLQPDRCAAYVLPRVLSENTLENPDPRIRAALAKALTHSVSEVVEYAAEGIGQYLRGPWIDVAQRCVGAVARQANLIDALQAAEQNKPWRERLHGDDLIQRVVPDVRTCIEGGDLDVEDELARLDRSDWPGRVATQTILQILAYSAATHLAVQFYGRVATALVESWDADRRHRGSSERDFEFEYDCSQRVARFVLKLQASDALALCEPLLQASGNHPRETAQFVRDLFLEEDRLEGETPFWQIWQAFAERLCNAPWIENLDSRFTTGTELLNVIFLGLQWNEGVRHWRRLEGQAGRVDELVAKLPASSAALGAYCRFLYHVGEQSLPNGFVIVGERLGAGKPSEMLVEGNTVFYLESLLRRYVCGEPLRLKSNPQVRTAILRILDDLVDAGSSAAYRMRDDFVTPGGSGNFVRGFPEILSALACA